MRRLRFDRMATCAALLLAGACSDAGGGADGGAQGTGGDFGGTGGRAEPPDDPGSGGAGGDATGDRDAGEDPCVEVTVGKLDLLFVVDDSVSMYEEQESLRREFPRLIDVLTSGKRPGRPDMPPITDLHLGVVSTDMGLQTVQGIPGCEGAGQDAILQNAPSPLVTMCDAEYPRFLTYDAEVDDPSKFAQDFACIATLGTDGCGFEQPLEATLKAVWPSADPRVTFVNDPASSGGQGDRANAGFIRSAREEAASAVAVVLVTDEEDCSAQDYRHFTPNLYLPDGDPLLEQDLNTRCFHNKDNLYAVDRYIDALKGVRPRREGAVLFAAIAGVPPEAVSPDARAGVDFDNSIERDAYYDALLEHPMMQERLDQNPNPGAQGIEPSCTTASGTAYPPRRIVEVARGFGPQGIVQSICEPDFGPAMDVIIDGIGRSLDNVCVLE